jgi:hypothetical protein
LNKSAATAIALLLLGATALANDPPLRKEGLWMMHTVETENPGNKQTEFTQSTCRNHAYDQYEQGLIKDLMARTSTCTVTDSVHGDVYQSNQLCSVLGTTIDRKETTTYLGDSSIHFESHATLKPAMNGVSERTIITDQKYAGVCPAELQPGDMTSADGKIHHLWRH